VSDFLEVADNLERAITSWKEGDKKDVQSVLTGVDLVLRLFRSKLERWSVTVLDSKGKPFDPYVHHAVSQVPSANVTPGTVLHEVQKGYWMGERLLRPASVVVASAPETCPKPAHRMKSEARAARPAVTGMDTNVPDHDRHQRPQARAHSSPALPRIALAQGQHARFDTKRRCSSRGPAERDLQQRQFLKHRHRREGRHSDLQRRRRAHAGL
jgi:hypothetical protein